MTGVAAACPQCGAPLRFGGGQSLAAVCGHCRAAVARKGVEVALIGKIPDLVSTATRLGIGDAGKIDGKAFQIVGRLQIDQGAAAWDEWYLSFADGGDGWLAEARGGLYATRRFGKNPALPPFESLRPGTRVRHMTVDEVGEARFVSADGELPFQPEVGATYRFADLSGGSGEFATIDYSGQEPELFVGRKLDYGEAGLAAAIASRGRAPAEAGPEGRALACPGCGAPVPLKGPESATAACGSCRSLLDVHEGALGIVGKLGERTEPILPLGAKGVLRGENVEVLGYLRRYVQYGEVKYRWSEWQLWGSKGYAWLSEYDGHWTSLVPIPGGQVEEESGGIRSGGDLYRHFQTATAHYEDIQGELSWQARIEETQNVRDYTAPPKALSAEEEKGEVNWARGEWLPPEEVWAAFKLPGVPPRPIGVGMAQPNRWLPMKRQASRWAWAGAALLILGSFFLAGALPHQVVASFDVPLPAEGTTISPPFELAGEMQSLEIVAEAPLNQSWVALDLALINEDNGDARSLGFELSRFEGIDEGEHWSEGSRARSAVLGSVPRGRYLLRVDVSLDPGSRQLVPPNASIRVKRGVFVYGPMLLGLLALIPVPLVLGLLSASFERRRWEQSDTDDEEDE